MNRVLTQTLKQEIVKEFRKVELLVHEERIERLSEKSCYFKVVSFYHLEHKENDSIDVLPFVDTARRIAHHNALKLLKVHVEEPVLILGIITDSNNGEKAETGGNYHWTITFIYEFLEAI